MDFSLHPDFDLSDDAEGGAPTNYNNDGVSPSPSEGDVVKPSSIMALFAELDLLRTQVTNIQSQLDGQRAVSADFARSLSNMQREIVTLRDASKSHSDMIGHAIKIVDESHGRILEFKSVASDLTYQFHTVSTTVDKFIAQKTTSTSTSPPVQSPTIEEAFAAADAVLCDGIASIENEVGDRLDRKLSSQANTTSTPGVRFTDVNERWRNQEPYDSDAAYAAAHARSTTSSTPDSTTAREFSTRAQECSSTNSLRHSSPRGSYGDSLSPRFNGPTSPRYRLAITRGLSSEILAWHAGELSGGGRG